MSAALAPWLAVAGLGAFHGLNPAMGWLFAVGLGLHRRSRGAVWAALAPIVLGHALAVAVVVIPVVAFGRFLDHTSLARGAGIVLVLWAVWHVLYGHRRRVRVGMEAGLAGLGLWSVLMASAHGAGLMLLPVVLPLCLTGTPGAELTSGASLTTAVAALGVHTAAMLAVIGAIAVAVYEWIGVAFLRRAWINLDFLWGGALMGSGALLLAS